jgi:type VI secretion system protein ImpL
MIYLQHIEGSKKGQAESFESDRIRIGRQPDNDLKFDPQAEREVSGHHAEIIRAGDRFAIKDLQSRNGTFVNSRRVDAPTPLAEGDIIQFSPRGPKVVFSLRDPAAGSGTVAVSREALLRPEPARKSRALSAWTLALAAAGVVAALAAAAWWSWTAFLVALAVVVVGVAGGLVWWWKRRRAAPPAEPRGAAEERPAVAPAAAGGRDDLKDLRDKWAAALARLRKSNLQQRGDDAVYALPWFLVLGERGCGKTAAIRAAGPLAPISPEVAGPHLARTQSCDWWFFDDTVLLDTPGRYAFPVDEAVDGREWREVLALLKRTRGKEPINGVIVAVGADTLASRSPDRLHDEAGRLRRRLDEMTRQLGTSFPVYLLVTKTDLVSGFSEFFTHLPEPVRTQAMGVVNEDLDHRGQAAVFVGQAVRTICDRLDRLRLTLLESVDGSGGGGKLFLFPEELRSLRAPLQAFTDALFRQNPYEETPPLRGLFFTSARQEGAPVSRLARALGVPGQAREAAAKGSAFFARDVFAVILGQDRAVVRRTARWRARHQRGQRVALITTAVICLVAAGLLTWSYLGNRRLLAGLDLAACVRPPGAGAAPRPIIQRLQELDACRASIDGLSPQSFWRRASLDFGLGQASPIEEPLKRRYLAAYRGEILDPLEARVERKLVPGAEAPFHVSALIQRIGVLTRCRRQEACPGPQEQVRPGYRVMLASEYPAIQDTDPLVAQLLRTDTAYLRWQPDPEALDELRARGIQRVMRWLGAGGLRPQWILASASAQFPPVRYKDFWGVDGPQVEAPYTRQAWAQGIQPLLAGLREMAPEVKEVKESLTQFEADYRGESLRQWGQFLTGFLQFERVGRGRAAGRDLAARVLGAESPYGRVVEAAAENLAPLLATEAPDGTIPPWADTLRRYGALRARVAGEKPDPQKPAATSAAGAKPGEGEREALGYLAGYQQALEQLRGELTTPEKAFRSAQKAMEEGEGAEKGTHPVHRAVWNLQRLRGSLGSRLEEDRLVWGLLLRPVEMASRVMMDEAGGYLQQQWDGLWLELTELTPGQKVGKVMGFVNGPAAVFLERRGDRFTPRKLMGEHTAFTGPFLEYLSRSRGISPDDPGRLDPPRQIVASP